MLFEIVVYFLCGLFCVLVYLSYVSLSKPKNFPPGPPALPIFGSFYLLRSDFHNTVQEFAKQYGNIFHASLATSKIIFISGYDLIKDVLRDRPTQFSDRKMIGRVSTIRGSIEGIVSQRYGPKWAAQRKTFHIAMRKMGLGKRNIGKLMVEELVYIEKELKKYCDKNELVNPGNVLEFASLNIISLITMGNRYEYDDRTLQKLIELNQEVFQRFNVSSDPLSFIYILFPSLGKVWKSQNIKKLKFAYDAFYQYFRDQIRTHKESIDEASPRDFIDHYLIEIKSDSENHLTDKGLQNCVVDMFQAGVETTSTTLKWAILYMVNNLHIQDKVQEEIANVLGDKQVTYEDKLRLPYCDATVLEVQRKATIGPFGLNHAPIQDETIAGYNIPKGMMLLLSYHSVHYSKEHWKNPTEFDPDNFLDDDGSVGTREAFFPYGGGRRICLGMEIAKMELFIFFVGIMQKFKFSLPRGVDKLSENCISGVTLVPNPYRVVIKRI